MDEKLGMKYKFHKKFKKEFNVLTLKHQEKFWKRLELFLENPNHPLLRYHELSGALLSHYSINITGDIRAIFIFLDQNTVEFVHIGTHAQLY